MRRRFYVENIDQMGQQQATVNMIQSPQTGAKNFCFYQKGRIIASERG
jgi:hypothetical protein